MTQRQKIIFISVFVIIGFIVSVAYHYFVAHVLNYNYYPYNTFLFRPNDRFMDFLDIFNAGSSPYRQIGSNRAMFPFFMLLAWVMYFVDNRIILLGIYIVLSINILITLIWHLTRRQSAKLRILAVFGFVFCSYPSLISIDRANIENGVFLLVFISIILAQKNKYVAAGLLMGIAIALKPYSIFLLPLFLMDGQILP